MLVERCVNEEVSTLGKQFTEANKQKKRQNVNRSYLIEMKRREGEKSTQILFFFSSMATHEKKN